MGMDHGVGLRLLMVAGVAATIGAWGVVAFGSGHGRRDERSAAAQPVASLKADALDGRLTRCRLVGPEQMEAFAGCRLVWAENRRRFLGQAVSRTGGEAGR